MFYVSLIRKIIVNIKQNIMLLFVILSMMLPRYLCSSRDKKYSCSHQTESWWGAFCPESQCSWSLTDGNVTWSLVSEWQLWCSAGSACRGTWLVLRKAIVVAPHWFYCSCVSAVFAWTLLSPGVPSWTGGEELRCSVNHTGCVSAFLGEICF